MNTKVIAEIGVNHNGDYELSRKMLKSASESGANIVKFQTHIADKEMIGDIGKYATIFPTIYDHIDNLSLSFDEMKNLKTYSDELGVEFLSTPFSVEAVDWLEDIGVNAYKIGSGETDDFLLLERICRTGKLILISTGMSSMEEVNKMVHFLNSMNANFILMQCTSHYPASYDVINLKVLDVYRKEFNCNVGLSDHSPSIYTSLAAVAMGAIVVEKHFTIDKSLPGTDQEGSILPNELKEMVKAIKIVEECMGDGNKNSVIIDENVMKLFKHGIVAKKDLAKGDVIGVEDIASKRPLVGIPSCEYQNVIGKSIKNSILRDSPILFEDIS
jgi:N,N'-diacetyllegionaminate synthase